MTSRVSAIISRHGTSASDDHSHEPRGVFVWGSGEGSDAEDDLADGGFLLIAAPHASMTLRAAEAGYVAARHAAPLRSGCADVCGAEQSRSHRGTSVTAPRIWGMSLMGRR